MLTVYDVKKMNNGMSVLICDIFDDSKVTEKLSTDIGVFSKKEFEIGQLHYCFSEPKTRMIMLRTHHDCSRIHKVDFI